MQSNLRAVKRYARYPAAVIPVIVRLAFVPHVKRLIHPTPVPHTASVEYLFLYSTTNSVFFNNGFIKQLGLVV